MKRLICISLVLLMAFSLASCFKSDKKFDYDMSKYITIPAYDGYKIDIEESAIQAGIDSYLMEYATAYTVQRGDKICIELTVNKVDFFVDEQTGTTVNKEGEQIVKEDNLWITVGDGSISKKAESAIIGAKIGDVAPNEYVLRGEKNYRLTDFYLDEYNNTDLKVVIKVKNMACRLGDVVNVAYTGYLLQDGTDNVAKDEQGKDKIFDENTTDFYIGSHMAIDEFESNLKGMQVGEVKEFFATFPDDYHEDTVKGKRVKFKVELKSISVPPVFDNAFVKKYFNDLDDTEAFKESLKEQYTLSKVLEYISEKCEIKSYPKAEYNASADELKNVEESFYKEYGITLDSYIKSYYGMTRDEYIKSNMKSEMVYYALSQLENIVPNDAQLQNEKQSLIDYYKSYYMTNNGLTEKDALTQAEGFVESLGETYIYENVMFLLVDERLVEKADVTLIPKDFTSITEIIANAQAGVTE